MRRTVPRPEQGHVVYPTSDGQPMAETEAHWRWTVDTADRLARRYADRPDVHVGSDLLLYWVEGDPRKSISPDVYVTFGMDKALRDNYLVWKEGKAPDVVFELTSRSTRRHDLGPKKDVYARIGVREYFLYDPFGEYLDPPLAGYRLLGDDAPEYLRVAGPPLASEVLDLLLSLDERKGLVLTDRGTGAPLLTGDEAAKLALRELERARELAAQEAERAAQEAERARQAEARIRELEQLLRGRSQ